MQFCELRNYESKTISFTISFLFQFQINCWKLQGNQNHDSIGIRIDTALKIHKFVLSRIYLIPAFISCHSWPVFGARELLCERVLAVLPLAHPPPDESAVHRSAGRPRALPRQLANLPLHSVQPSRKLQPFSCIIQVKCHVDFTGRSIEVRSLYSDRTFNLMSTNSVPWPDGPPCSQPRF